jgi:hypothetical protein
MPRVKIFGQILAEVRKQKSFVVVITYGEDYVLMTGARGGGRARKKADQLLVQKLKQKTESFKAKVARIARIKAPQKKAHQKGEQNA